MIMSIAGRRPPRRGQTIAWVMLACFLAGRSVWAASSGSLDVSSASNPPSTEVAQALYEQGRYQEAAASFKAALADPRPASSPISSSAPANDLLDDATRNLAYQQAIAEGELCERQEGYSRAVQAFERALRIDPLNRDAAERLIRIKEAQKTRELMTAPEPSDAPPMATTGSAQHPPRPSWLRRVWTRATRSTRSTPENLERQLQQVESAIAVTKQQQAELETRIVSHTAQLKAREADAHTLHEQLKSFVHVSNFLSQRAASRPEEPLESSGQGRAHVPDIDHALEPPR